MNFSIYLWLFAVVARIYLICIRDYSVMSHTAGEPQLQHQQQKGEISDGNLRNHFTDNFLLFWLMSPHGARKEKREPKKKKKKRRLQIKS